MAAQAWSRDGIGHCSILYIGAEATNGYQLRTLSWFRFDTASLATTVVAVVFVVGVFAKVAPNKQTNLSRLHWLPRVESE